MKITKSKQKNTIRINFKILNLFGKYENLINFMKHNFKILKTQKFTKMINGQQIFIYKFNMKKPAKNLFNLRSQTINSLK